MKNAFALRKEWISTGSCCREDVLEVFHQAVGREKETAKILLELLDSKPRTNDGETRHILAARNKRILETAFQANPALDFSG